MLDGEKGKWGMGRGKGRGGGKGGKGGRGGEGKKVWVGGRRWSGGPSLRGKKDFKGKEGSGEERRGAKRSEKYRGEGMYGSSVTKDLAYSTFIMPLRRQYPVSNPSDRIES